MIAIEGIYDGKVIQPLEPIHAKPNARVIITFLEKTSEAPAFPRTRHEDVAGCLQYHGPAKTLEDMEAAIERGAKESMP